MSSLIAIHPAILAAGTGLIGLCVGSFLNVVIYRLPIMLERDWRSQCRELLGRNTAEGNRDWEEPFNLWVPRSRCPNCHGLVGALQNIPVLSYVWLRGRCARCGVRIPARYPIVEILTTVTFVFVALRFGWTWETPAALVLTGALIALTFIDLDHQILPDMITLPLVWLGLVVNLFDLFTDIRSAVIGAVAGYVALWLVFHAFRLITGKEGMGFGDFKLLAVFGAWLGWHLLPFIVLISAFVGAVVGVALIVFRGRDRNIPIPFGPFLAGAGWIAMLWGEEIVSGYLQFAGLS